MTRKHFGSHSEFFVTLGTYGGNRTDRVLTAHGPGASEPRRGAASTAVLREPPRTARLRTRDAQHRSGRSGAGNRRHPELVGKPGLSGTGQSEPRIGGRRPAWTGKGRGQQLRPPPPNTGQEPGPPSAGRLGPRLGTRTAHHGPEPEGRPVGRRPWGTLDQGGGPNYLRMLCASMLRFWLLEHTTATRSGDDGMAAAAQSATPASELPPSRAASARARWRPLRPEVMM